MRRATGGIYRAAERPWRARPGGETRRGLRRGSRHFLLRGRATRKEEDDPDGRAPPGSEMREEWGRAGWAGTGNGPAVWAAGEGKEKGEEGNWAGWAEKRWGEGEMFCIFF